MITVEKINTRDRSEVRRFLQFPFKLYQEHPLWVPPILIDARAQLNPDVHPFYEHSHAEFFLALRDGEVAGRIALMENKPYNRYHDRQMTQFFLFECVEDFGVASQLFERAIEWTRARGLTQILGPKGFGALDGYGMLVEGFEHRPAMTMMSYNPPYYSQFMERLGFRKEVDFISCYLGRDRFALPERVHRIAERAARRSGFRILRFKNKKEMRAWAPKIGKTYNQAFINNWEYYPLSEREIKFLTDNILTIADPRLIKIIAHDDEAIGFLFGFRDISAAIQRNKGKLLPFGIFDMLLEMKRTKWVDINGAGILPEYQGRGGNALLYSEMEKTIREYGFLHAELVQVAETAVQMRSDLENVGGVPYKNHRVYILDI
jgi:GNAT superfamily N-acetyltransferase